MYYLNINISLFFFAFAEAQGVKYVSVCLSVCLAQSV